MNILYSFWETRLPPF